jgi:hypothetical protein
MRDKNSKFFHACASQRRSNNYISAIWDEEGTKRDSPEAVEEAFIDYFTKVFTSSNPTNTGECLGNLSRRVTDEMNESLLKEYTTEEVETTLQQMAHLKAPGLDGSPACFFQDHWDLLKGEVCGVALSFLNSGIFDNTVNYTHIALIPKKKQSY